MKSLLQKLLYLLILEMQHLLQSNMPKPYVNSTDYEKALTGYLVFLFYSTFYFTVPKEKLI